MRVIILRSNPVDPDSRVEKTADFLIKNGYQVEIIAWDRAQYYRMTTSNIDLDSGSVTIHRVGIKASFGGGMRRNLIPLLNFQIYLVRWLSSNRNHYDLIHACDFDTAYVGSIIARMFKKKLIYDIFDFYVDAFHVPNLLRNRIIKMEHKIINTADAVVLCSEIRRKQIQGTNPKRLIVIHNTPKRPEYPLCKIDLDPSKIKIVYVGILNNDRFIREITEYVVSNEEYELHIGGFGILEGYLRNLADRNTNIIFYGKLPYKKTLELENSCDIMVAIYDPAIPNHFYAAPNKFYEALMLGKPIIMVKNTGMDEIITENHFGAVMEEYNSENFSKALSSLASKRDQWEMKSDKMKEYYEKEYHWSKMEKRLVDLYAKLES